jgi:transposase
VPHHRARYTPLGRWHVVARVVEQGETFAQAAAWANVSKSTVWEWVARWRAASPVERSSLACLVERSSRPHRSPGRVPVEEEARICELRQRTGWSPRRLAVEVGRPHSTVHAVLRRGGCSRRPSPERPAVIRYEWPCPGGLLHMDTKRFGLLRDARTRHLDLPVGGRRVGPGAQVADRAAVQGRHRAQQLARDCPIYTCVVAVRRRSLAGGR